MEAKNEDIILALLYKVNTPINYTKLQKLTFLLEKEANITLNLDFVPYKYGPFSSKIYDIVEELERKSLVEIAQTKMITTQYGNAKIISITEKGKLRAMKAYEEMNKDDREKLDDIVKRWGHEPLSSLLVYTYLTYPETTKNSLIKDEVLS
jgi:uncharacterized protein YwgA